MSQEQHNTNLSLSVLLSILALIAGFVWDRVHLEAVDQRAQDEVQTIEKEDSEIRMELEKVRERQRLNEDRIMRLEDEVPVPRR